MNTVVEATYFAALKHASQRRKNTAKDPYINHPIEVARTLTECGVTDVATLCGAVLHDTVEDTGATPAELTQLFGSEICSIVLECSDDKLLDKVSRKRLQIEHAQHISDKARLVKLADKYSNISGLLTDPPSFWSKDEITGYVRWGFAVCQHLYGVNDSLDKLMQGVFESHCVTSVSEAELEQYYSLICNSE